MNKHVVHLTIHSIFSIKISKLWSRFSQHIYCSITAACTEHIQQYDINSCAAESPSNPWKLLMIMIDALVFTFLIQKVIHINQDLQVVSIFAARISVGSKIKALAWIICSALNIFVTIYEMLNSVCWRPISKCEIIQHIYFFSKYSPFSCFSVAAEKIHSHFINKMETSQNAWK
ncbi:hypothetical protein XELAEV_18027273mg [Xenopus laevis]|uniref:Uncharacterized protein n=1 Tax=Xenopus laevis TaxID=8355 RepID=A0A974CXD4_XENLA|nr:hypothetical protein XELAEV_18027273mg [Xenopus laevis]